MNVQTEYYIRLLLLLVQCGIFVCRGVTQREMTCTALSVYLKPHESKLKKKLLKSQYLILFPKTGRPDVEDLDLSLLTVLLLDVFTLSETEIQYLKTIKDTRNRLSHNAKASLTETEYKTMKTDLEKALNKLSLCLDRKILLECSRLIKVFSRDPLDESMALKYVKNLRNDDELLQDIEGMLEEQSEDIVQHINAAESRMQRTLLDMKKSLTSEMKKLHIGHIREDVQYYEFSDTLPSCEQCENGDVTKTAEIFCEDCAKFLCSECKIRIHTGKETHMHRRIVKGEPIKIDTKGYDVCFEHRKDLNYICKSENDLCCEECINEKHARCDDIVTISETVFESHFNPLTELPQLKNETRLLDTWLFSVESDLNKSVDNISLRLDEYRQSLLEKFDAEAQKVKDNADLMKNITMKEIESKRKSCKTLQIESDLSSIPLINMSKCGTVCQKRIAQHIIEQFVNKFKSLKEMNIVSLSSLHLNPPNYILQQPAVLVKPHVHIPDKRPVILQSISELEVKQKEDEKSAPFYCSIDYLPGGRLAIIDNFNEKVIVCDDEKFKTLASLNLSEAPLGIAVVAVEEVAIAMYKIIILLQVTKENKINFLKTVETKSLCTSMCMMDDRHFVVTAYDTKKPALIISHTGEEKDFNLNFPIKDYKLDATQCTFLKYSNKVAISYFYENSVTIYDIATKTGVIVKDDRLKEPRGMAVGPFDCIFVCGSLSRSIVQISPKGDIVSTHDIDMIHPFRICFSKDKTRCVVSNNSKGKMKMQVFKIGFGSS